MGIPAGKLVADLGYKGGMLLGFLVAAASCFLFYPAADSHSYPVFLGALFGLVADARSLRLALALALPALCYAYIVWYGLRGYVRAMAQA